MKNKQLLLEHGDRMFYSRELIYLQLPNEINLMFYTIISVFLCLLMALICVQINDVKKVSGIIKPMENISKVNNVISGAVKEIYYKPNQFVVKGQLLYSLEKESYEAIEKNIIRDIENFEEQIRCVDEVLNGINCNKIESQNDLNQISLFQLNEYFKTVSYLEKQIEILDYNYQKEIGLPQALCNESRQEEAYLNLCLSRSDLDKYKAEIVSKFVQQRSEYELQLDKTKQELIKIQKDYSFLDIKAPVDGFIQEITALNQGDYIFADQPVLNIIPDDRKNFRVELSIGTKDIGEIVPGMAVKYRLSAFPFFEYKGAQGTIKTIDSDIRENSDGRLLYKVYADIDKNSFTDGSGNEYPLKSGIEVDARIVMEKITLLNFILRKMDFIK